MCRKSPPPGRRLLGPHMPLRCTLGRTRPHPHLSWGGTLDSMARPSGIDRVLRHDRDGNPITVADHIAQAIAAGNYFEQACQSAGVAKSTAYRWLSTGAKAAQAINKLGPDAVTLTRNDRRCLEFWDAVTEAEARWEVSAVTQLEQLGRGGAQKVTITERVDPNGQLIEKTIRTETLPPDARVLMWRLERRFPDRYGHRVEFVGSVHETVEDREERLDLLAAQVEAFLAGRDDAAAEARESTATDDSAD